MGKKLARIIVFGTGNVYRWSSDILKEYTEIILFIDNDKSKWDTYLDGKKIVSPVSDVNEQYDYIVLASYYYVYDMRNQLYDLGCKKEKIIHIYELIKKIYESKNVELRFPEIASASETVLLISKHGGLGGGEIALANMATVLKNNGYTVVMCMPDAEDSYINLLKKRKIQYVVCPYVYYPSGELLSWICKFDHIVVNTIIMTLATCQICKRRPVIEWVHECRYMMYQYSMYFYNRFSECFYNSNTNLYSVSAVAQRCLRELFPKSNDKILPYGIEDSRKDQCYIHHGNSMSFAIIGRIERNKGDDLVIEAIKRVNKNKKIYAAKFLFIGKRGNRSGFAQHIIREIDNIPNALYLGELNREEMKRIYEEKIDVVIVASRQECLPTTSAEAMIFSHPSIVCDACGMSDYIKNGEDGIVFRTEDADDLGNKIVWCMENQKTIKAMGKNARKIYEREFSLEVFGERVIDIMNNRYDLRSNEEDI